MKGNRQRKKGWICGKNCLLKEVVDCFQREVLLFDGCCE